eukprot:jgi/Mesvir1/9028/Mv21311-RA.1
MNFSGFSRSFVDGYQHGVRSLLSITALFPELPGAHAARCKLQAATQPSKEPCPAELTSLANARLHGSRFSLVLAGAALLPGENDLKLQQPSTSDVLRDILIAGREANGGEKLSQGSQESTLPDAISENLHRASPPAYSDSNRCSLLDRSDNEREQATGLHFPRFLQAMGGRDCQVLAGTGVRSLSIAGLKKINVYAFGVYVSPEQLAARLGSKYAHVPPEQLRHDEGFFSEIVRRQDIDMTVRLVVAYRRLKMSYVRAAFEKSLRNRLAKLGANTDEEALRAFTGYFAREAGIDKGTTISFRREGGRLTTEVDGQSYGSIGCSDLASAMMDLYVGHQPVAQKAKQQIGERMSRLMQEHTRVCQHVSPLLVEAQA